MPPARQATVLGQRLEYAIAGNGGPAFVLLGGSGAPLLAWHRVFGPLAERRTTLAYARAGSGGSAKPVMPQTAGRMADELHALLDAAGVAPPWVLVAHSFGGLVANLFARRFADAVHGVVFVEATAPGDVAAMAGHAGPVQRTLQALLKRIAPPHPNAESEWADASVAEIAAAGPFPPLPLVVITGTRPAMAWATPRAQADARAAGQRALAALSPHGKQRLATRSGHFPLFTEPQLVVEACCSLLPDGSGAPLAAPAHPS
jgi:pimeloyl-ACP methyl ester carboxylesterase